jgi:hypothetical protein
VPRPSSPLDAKASVRSPYALDRSQQNSCVGVSLCLAGRTKDRTSAHTCASIFVFADKDVFSDPSWCFVSAWGGGRRPDRPFNSRCQICRRGQAGTETCIPRSHWRRLDGGARRDRTDDLMLAKHALYQLSYGPSLKRPAGLGAPVKGDVIDLSVRPRVTRSVVGPGGLEPPTSRLSGVCSNQLSYRP